MTPVLYHVNLHVAIQLMGPTAQMLPVLRHVAVLMVRYLMGKGVWILHSVDAFWIVDSIIL